MKRAATVNMAHSVHDRLLALAKKRGRPFNELFLYYAMERFLYRLAKSRAKRHFILKGALLLAHCADLPFRPTRDIDLLGRIENSETKVRDLLASVCGQKVPDDGMRFDAESITTERIREDADYPGVRAHFAAFLGRARTVMQVDVGFGDATKPIPQEIEYPVLLDQPAPRLRAYALETAVAEKLHVMVHLGEINSRMKDYLDIWFLCRQEVLKSDRLQSAIAATFTRRRTAIPTDPIGLSSSFARARETQWRGLLAKLRVSGVPDDLAIVIKDISSIVTPILRELQENGAASA